MVRRQVGQRRGVHDLRQGRQTGRSGSSHWLPLPATLVKKRRIKVPRKALPSFAFTFRAKPGLVGFGGKGALACMFSGGLIMRRRPSSCGRERTLSTRGGVLLYQ